jgi:predicted MFS family arabinose efflux permease
MRTLFPRVLEDRSLLHTAYAIDAALIEMVFVLGPVLVAGCVALGWPAAAIISAAACASAGSIFFLRSPLICDWNPLPVSSRRSLLGPLRYPKLVVVYAATVLYSLAFGLFQVAVTGFATQQGAPAAAAVLLAISSVGSAAGALYYGSHEWKVFPVRLYVLTQLAMAGGIVVLIPVTDLYVFAILALIGCSPIAPVLTAQSMLISHIAPDDMMAESFTWAATCLLGGISGGMSVGGWLVERWSPQSALVAAAAVTACAAFIVWIALPERSGVAAKLRVD